MAALFLSFFALAQARSLPKMLPALQPATHGTRAHHALFAMQALRLFVHYPFLVRAVHYHHSTNTDLAPAGLAGDNNSTFLEAEAVKTCLRGQTFFSLGLRFLYLFIPLVSPLHPTGKRQGGRPLGGHQPPLDELGLNRQQRQTVCLNNWLVHGLCTACRSPGLWVGPGC